MAGVLAWRDVEAYSSWCYAIGKAGEYKIYSEKGVRALYFPSGARAEFETFEAAKEAADGFEEGFVRSMKPTRGKFWMVYGIHQGAPRYEHRTLEGAQAEARRLAKLNHEITFVVLEVVDAYQAEEPKVVRFDIAAPVHDARHDPDDDIPF